MDASKNRGTHRLRLGRYSESGRIYLVTASTYARRPWFANLGYGRLVVSAFKYQHERRNLDSLAFVVMPDHFHWLLQLAHDSDLSRVIQQVKGFAGKRILASGGSGGPVWQPGFHDRALRTEEDLRSVARYVVANPVRAGLVSRLGDYPLWDAVWL